MQGSIYFRSRIVVNIHAAHLHDYLMRYFSKLKWLPDLTLTADKIHYKNCMGQKRKTLTVHSRHFTWKGRRYFVFIFLYSLEGAGSRFMFGLRQTRCLYCDKQAIYKENEETVVLAVESNLYACGSPIFPDRHPLSELIRVRTSTT